MFYHCDTYTRMKILHMKCKQGLKASLINIFETIA